MAWLAGESHVGISLCIIALLPQIIQSRESLDRRPHYVLAEEHHHMAPHLLRLAANGVLRKENVAQAEDEDQAKGALMIHIDSHSDGALPEYWQHPDEMRFWKEYLHVANGDEDIRALGNNFLGQVDIYNFILPLGYADIVEHFVFVEPPWGNMFDACFQNLAKSRDDYYHSWFIYIGYEQNQFRPGQAARSRFFLTNAHETEEDMDDRCYGDILDMIHFSDGRKLHQVFSLSELHSLCGGPLKIKRMRFTPVRYEDAPRVLARILRNDLVPPIFDETELLKRPIWMDIDLDGFGTFSPGGKATYDAIPDWEDLMTIHHTLKGEFLRSSDHDTSEETETQLGFCDFDAEYWENVMEGKDTSNCNHNYDLGWNTTSRFDITDHIAWVKAKSSVETSLVARRLLRNILEIFDKPMRPDVFYAIANILTRHENTLNLVSQKKGLTRKFIEFIKHPFFVNDDATDTLIEYWKRIWKDVFVLGNYDINRKLQNDERGKHINLSFVPDVVTISRSPFYTPDHNLATVECSVLEALRATFGIGSGIVEHFSDVNIEMTGCVNAIRSTTFDGEKREDEINEGRQRVSLWDVVDVGPTGSEKNSSLLWSVDIHGYAFRYLFPEQEEINLIFKMNEIAADDDNLSHFNGVILLRDDIPEMILRAGNQIQLLSYSGETWTIYPTSSKLIHQDSLTDTILFNEFVIHVTGGEIQYQEISLSSKSSEVLITRTTVPIEDETPVDLFIFNPHDSNTQYEVHFVGKSSDVDMNTLESNPNSVLETTLIGFFSPGKSKVFGTFHNHVFIVRAHTNGGEETENSRVIVADATSGDDQHFNSAFEGEL